MSLYLFLFPNIYLFYITKKAPNAFTHLAHLKILFKGLCSFDSFMPTFI
ncbi:conserved hypothetical protein [Listeria monocytogenes FSL R2-503]|nr:conserved hypothetical protein [Listeria monocytogenes FSL R2-503]